MYKVIPANLAVTTKKPTWQRLERERERRGGEGGEQETMNRERSCIIQPDEDNAPWFAHHFGGVSSSETGMTGDDAVPRVCVRVSIRVNTHSRVNVISATDTRRDTNTCVWNGE